jgi:acyl-CoA thioester hydrolase
MSAPAYLGRLDSRPVASAQEETAAETRGAYPHLLAIPTRWLDNDVYGHVNNVQYYSFFDTVINRWLIEEGGLDIRRGQVIGVCAESRCRFEAPLSFPEGLDAGLRVGELGRSSVRYEIGLFREGSDELLATGWFVHVFVDRESRRPAEIPRPIRQALERLVVGR